MNTEIKQQDRVAELHYGIKGDKVVHISEVESGLQCNCICPGCEAPLVARKGEIRTHHFAHYQGSDSQACIETALHMYAKQVIQTEKKVMIPDDQLTVSVTDNQGKAHVKNMKIIGTIIEFEQVGVEVFKGKYRSDATGYPYEQQDIDIEILVSHKVDDDKKTKVELADSCMMEIDLSRLPKDASPQEIKQAVIHDAPRIWINNPVHQQELARMRDEVVLLAQRANEQAEEAAKAIEEEKKAVAVLETEVDDFKSPLIPMTPGNFVLLGFKVGHGYSPRYERNFELSKLYTSRRVVSSSTRNFTCTQSGGFELEEFDLDESCIRKLKSLNYPIEAELVMGNKLSGRRFIPVVLDIKAL